MSELPERSFHSGKYSEEVNYEKNSLLEYVVGMEKDLMKMKRAEKVLHEVEQRYLALMDSSVFLCVLLTPDGRFRAMNRRAEEFFGFQTKSGTDVVLQSLSGPGYTGEVDSMIKDAMKKPFHATLPVTCRGSIRWLDMEFSRAEYQGDISIQIIAIDITDIMNGKSGENPVSPESSPAFALQALNACPGLICFVVDRSGVLLYSTEGYKEVSKRFLGHKCLTGAPYPVSLDTPFDLDLQDIIKEAFKGNSATACLIETGEVNKKWDIVGAPLLSSAGAVVGAVINLAANREPAALPLPPKPSETSPSQIEFLNAIPRMFFVMDDEARCVEANLQFLNALKLDNDNLAGRLFEEFLLEGDPLNDKFSERFAATLKEKQFDDIECKIAARDGEILSLGLRGSRIVWEGKTRILVSCVDNTRLRRTEEQLKRVSTIDPATGTLNRQGLERVLSTEIERASRYKGSLSVIIVDIDGFRGLNERIGYSASDKILKELMGAIKSRIRLTDFLGRWSGDEFMILTPLPLPAAMQLAEKLKDMVEHAVFGENISFTISAGVAEYKKSMDISSFVGSAYDAMTEAKRGGGNRTVRAKDVNVA